jgi:superfamily II DNA helicase RecQ
MTSNPYFDITHEAMNAALGHSPRGFQSDIIPRIISMNNRTTNTIQPTLLVQGTGSGKSSVYQTIGVIKGGVSLIIENTLSLSSDQLSKITNISTRLPHVHSFQLDSIKASSTRTLLSNQIKNLNKHSTCTIFLFASPESLIIKPWMSLIHHIIENNTLKQICIDEVHLYVIFAITFRHTPMNIVFTLSQYADWV